MRIKIKGAVAKVCYNWQRWWTWCLLSTYPHLNSNFAFLVKAVMALALGGLGGICLCRCPNALQWRSQTFRPGVANSFPFRFCLSFFLDQASNNSNFRRPNINFCCILEKHPIFFKVFENSLKLAFIFSSMREIFNVHLKITIKWFILALNRRKEK